jgi:competence protein ComFC
MRCILCKSFSFSIICKKCQNRFLSPSPSVRILADSLKVYSFFGYSDIKRLLKTKHTFLGSFVYSALAKNSFYHFAKEFSFSSQVYALAIDDDTKSGYSHTAILANSLKSKNIRVLFNSLKAKNKINYSGKSLDFRLKNPRDFEYRFKKGCNVILVDDIVTTGTTLSEAYTLLKKEGVNVLFALVLADASK